MCSASLRSASAAESTPTASKESTALAQEYIDAFCKRERLRVGIESLQRDVAKLTEAGRAGSPTQVLTEQFKSLPAEVRPALGRVLGENFQTLPKNLAEANKALGTRVSDLTASWTSIRGSLAETRLLLFKVGGNRQVAGQLASLLSVDNRWFWLFGLLALTTLVVVVLHERRREYRRSINGGRGRALSLSTFLALAMLLLIGLTVVSFLKGDEIYESLLQVGGGQQVSPREEILKQNKEIAAELPDLQKQHEELRKQHADALAAIEKQLAGVLPEGNRLPAAWKEARAQVLQLAENLSLLERLPDAIQADLTELNQQTADLTAQREATLHYVHLRRWIRGGLGLGLLGLTLGGGWLFHRGVTKRRRRTAATCPLCLGAGHLEPAPDFGTGEMAVVRCKNVICEEPYEECDYTFMDLYRPMSKLCFPTLGVPQAGKTHWLTMLYWELSRGNYPKSVRFEKIKSQTAQDYDMVVEEILNSRIGTAATQRERIPHPLVFNFQDRDRLGRSNVLVNIFDYSGEVTADMGVDDYRRRRALDGDGFLFFLDPTYPSEPQARALASFREDIRLVKGIKGNRRVRVPVALCVSKIDLLAGRSYALPGGGDAIGWFYDELKKIDPTGESMSMRVLHARSRLLARLRDTIWPGWQIEQQIDDLFGGRYLFFPLTPVGLDGIGETDLSLRTISPFGLLEPLLWLLEMNGYPVLK